MEGKLPGLKPGGAQALCSRGLPRARALTSPVQWVLAIPAGGEGRLCSTHGQGGQQQHDEHPLGLPAQKPGPQPRPGHRVPPTVPAAIPRAAHSSGQCGPAAHPGLHLSPCQSTQVTLYGLGWVRAGSVGPQGVGGMNTHPSTKTRPAAAPSPTGKEHSTASSMATGATEKPKSPSSEQMAASASICPRSWDTWAARRTGHGHQTCRSPTWPAPAHLS